MKLSLGISKDHVYVILDLSSIFFSTINVLMYSEVSHCIHWANG